ncbi:MAG: tetraacyldisaccharide 4'-kinase [Flavobacteriaceae bacterium]|nr:tetraacyldisaccharide 4'-kinase [Flavobacteriaceae bacterium]
MSLLRKILYPFSLLYGEVTAARNKLYDKGVLKSTRFDIPVIVVGNLSVGGTGKSPQIEYLIRLLKDTHKVAVLSRGYKRTSKGFIAADENASAESIGDEPMQFYTKFRDQVIVAVDADRVNGITQLQERFNPDIILLDDAYQHRKVEPGFTILLTPYDRLYVDDMMLPTGELREKVEGADRAQVIIVTKCPESLTEEAQFEITKKLNVELHQTVFFTKIAYSNDVIGKKDQIPVNDLRHYEILLVTGIAKTRPLTDFLSEQKIDFEHLAFKDHHNFTEKDFSKIETQFSELKSDQRLILTTEKDYVRAFTAREDVYYLPIKTEFLEHRSDFDTLIKKSIIKELH